MGGDAGSMLGNVAGRVLGVLSALPSRGGGFSNLANYMAARQRAMSDPNARAALTPFGAGFYQIGGGMERQPGQYQPVAAPADFMGPTIPTAAGPADVRYMPGAMRWRPDLPPLAPEAALKEEATRRTIAGLQSPDVVTRARAKQDAGIPLAPEETDALVAAAREFQRTAPEGSSVSIGPGGTTITVGSRYALPPGVVQTPAQGEMPLAQLQPQLQPGQVPQATGRRNAQGQDLYQAVTPPKVDLRPPTLNLPGAPPAAGPPSIPVAPPSPEPGKVNLSAPFFRQLEAERGLPAGILSAMAEKESGGDPQAANPESSARGLFQITRDTARAWKISADDRFDPVKSAIATANTLAARAQQYGIERAVGMHYGGPGAPFGEVVGPSGLSPAQYAADVFRRTQKYLSPGVAYAAEAPPAAAPPPAAPVAVTPPPPPPAAPVVVAPMPPAAAPPPAAPSVVAAPAPAPVMVAAAAPPPENLVGYPPPAPSAPSVPATSIVLPPEAGTQLVTPAAPAPVVGPGGMPLETVTQQSQAGETATYKAPADLAAAQRAAVMKQDVERLRGAGTVEDTKALNALMQYRAALAKFKAEFPTPADRAPYAGHPWKQKIAPFAEYFQEPPPRRVDFEQATAPFSLKAFETSGASMSEHEREMILPTLPTGLEPSATRFERKIGDFEDALDAALAFRTTISRLPVEQRTPEVLDEVQRQVLAQQQVRKAAREEAAGRPPAGTAVAPAAPAPPAPPTPWGPEATARPPEAAAAGVPTTLAQTRQVLLPERSFFSQLPSVGGAIGGGMAGAALGAPFLPPVGPIVGGLIGAGLGAGGLEAAQTAVEPALGLPPAEPGTALERAGRAAARGAVGEALGTPLRVGSWLVTSRAGPIVEAARDLAPVLRQDLPAATKAVETTAGTFHRIGRLLKDPEALAAAELTPESQQTLLRAWWGQVAAKKPEKIVEAWEAFGPEAQATLAGSQRAAMDTVIDTLKTGATPFDWGMLLGGGGVAGLGALSGMPGVGMVVGGLPAAVAVGREAARAVPTIASPLLRTSAGAARLAGLPLAGEVAPPWLVSLPLRGATQAGTAALWPQAAP